MVVEERAWVDVGPTTTLGRVGETVAGFVVAVLVLGGLAFPAALLGLLGVALWWALVLAVVVAAIAVRGRAGLRSLALGAALGALAYPAPFVALSVLLPVLGGRRSLWSVALLIALGMVTVLVVRRLRAGRTDHGDGPAGGTVAAVLAAAAAGAVVTELGWPLLAHVAVLAGPGVLAVVLGATTAAAGVLVWCAADRRSWAVRAGAALGSCAWAGSIVVSSWVR